MIQVLSSIFKDLIQDGPVNAKIFVWALKEVETYNHNY